MAAVGLLAWLPLAPHPVCWSPSCCSPAHRGATGLLIWESGVAAGQYGSIFVWATLVAGCYFFPRRVAIAHLVWLLAVYALTLAPGRKHRRLLAADPLAVHRRSRCPW